MVNVQSKEWLKMVAIIYLVAHILAWITFGDVILEEFKLKK